MTDQPTPEEELFPGASSSSSDPANDPANGDPGAAFTPSPSQTLPTSATAATAARPAGPAQPPVQHVHKATGYTWEKDEDAPGYAWKNKKAQEEAIRALDQMVDKDKTIGRKYGDIGGVPFPEEFLLRKK